jgi:hypothetical protein
MITNPVLTNQSNSGNGQEPTNIQRRTLIGGALAALFSSSVRLMAEENDDGPMIRSSFCRTDAITSWARVRGQPTTSAYPQ